MNRFVYTTAAALGISQALWMVNAIGAERAAPHAPVHRVACDDGCSTTCETGEFGTALRFEKTPSDAAAKAKKQEKLVMVLHVSGHFEDPKHT